VFYEAIIVAIEETPLMSFLILMWNTRFTAAVAFVVFDPSARYIVLLTEISDRKKAQ
jgi:hypothetical protein